jgi:hypothetical protein
MSRTRELRTTFVLFRGIVYLMQNAQNIKVLKIENNLIKIQKMEVTVHFTLVNAYKYFKYNANIIKDQNKVIASLLVQLINSSDLKMEGSDFAQIASLINDKVDTESMRKLTELMVSLMNSGIEFKKEKSIKNKIEEIPKIEASMSEEKSWASIVAKPPSRQDTPRPENKIKITNPCEYFKIDLGTYASGIELGKYKIVRCANEFNENGKCSKGNKCDFAHSSEELKWFLEFQKNKNYEEAEGDDYTLSDDE